MAKFATTGTILCEQKFPHPNAPLLPLLCIYSSSSEETLWKLGMNLEAQVVAVHVYDK